MCFTAAEKALTKEERKQAFKNYLASNCYPFGYSLVMSTILLLIGLCMIVFGILAVVYKTPLGYVGSG